MKPGMLQDRWLLTAVRGHLGGTSAMRRPVVGLLASGPNQAVPQRCWAAWRVMPSWEPISAQE